MSKKKPILLSFEDDDNDNDNDITLKIKKKRKIKQAPNVYDININDNISQISSYGGHYSTENVAELIKNQKFVSINTTSTNTNDKNDENDNNNDNSNDIVIAGDDIDVILDDNDDIMSRDKVRFDYQKESSSNSNSNADSFNQNNVNMDIYQSTSKVNIDTTISYEEDDEWERDILKRSGTKAIDTIDNRTTVPSLSTTTTTSNSSITSSNISINDMMKLILNTSNKLRIQCETSKQSIDLLHNEQKDKEKDYESLKSTMEHVVNNLNFLEEFRIYGSELVGMLREKQTIIEGYKMELMTILISRRNSIIKENVRKHAYVIGDLMGIDDYDYSAIISSMHNDDNDSNNNNKTDLSIKCIDIMSDVRSDLSSLPIILSHIGKLRSSFRKHYTNAFISLSLHKMLEPLILLDLITVFAEVVDKTDTNDYIPNINLYERKWYQDLSIFSYEEDSNDTESDYYLLPKIIVSSIIPFLSEVIDVALDPSSKHQCKIVKEYLQFLIKQEPAPSQILHLITAVNNAFTRHIEVIHLPFAKVPYPYSQYHISQYNQVASCLENLAIFKDIISSNITSIIALNSLKVYSEELKKCHNIDEKYQQGLPHVYNAIIRLCKSYIDLVRNDTKHNELIMLMNKKINDSNDINEYQKMIMNIIDHVLKL